MTARIPPEKRTKILNTIEPVLAPTCTEISVKHAESLSAKDHEPRTSHEPRSTEHEGRLPAFAPGCGGQEGETQSPKGARKTRTGRRVTVPEELARPAASVVGWQQLLIKLMHFHSPCYAYNAPNEPFTTYANCVYKNQN